MNDREKGFYGALGRLYYAFQIVATEDGEPAPLLENPTEEHFILIGKTVSDSIIEGSSDGEEDGE